MSRRQREAGLRSQPDRQRRHPQGGAQAGGPAALIAADVADEARPVQLSRSDDDRGGGGDPGAGRAGRRPRAGRRAEPGPDHGIPAGASAPSGRHQRRRRAQPPRGRGRQALHRRRRAPCRVPQAGGGGAARPPAGRRGAPHRASSDPRPRHVLRQHRPRRSGLRMVRARGGARRRNGGALGARHARHPGAGFLQGHHDHGAARRRAAGRGAAAGAAGRRPRRLLRVQPARRRLSRSPWRW